MSCSLETERLILRAWQEKDADAYFQINHDPLVLEFLPAALTKAEVETFIAAMNSQLEARAFTLWAVELKENGQFIGFIGLNAVPWQAHFTPAVEIGWRLGSQYWGKGYATEGAKACLNYGFNTMGLEEIVAFTVPANKRSIRVMEKIAMQRDLQGDFAHPRLPAEHPLKTDFISYPETDYARVAFE